MHSSDRWKPWKKSPFSLVIQECGAAGDCMFHCLAVGLKNITTTKSIDMMSIREMLSTSITLDNMEEFLKLTIEDHKNFVPSGSQRLECLLALITANNNPECKQKVLGLLRKIILKKL